MPISLQRIPRRYACGHFELTSPYAVTVETLPPPGYMEAQSVCSACSPQGRIVKEHYDLLEDAQAAALERCGHCNSFLGKDPPMSPPKPIVRTGVDKLLDLLENQNFWGGVVFLCFIYGLWP
jgi:hypothetical protein